MPVRKTVLDFYSRPGAMTAAGKYAALLERLPNDVAALVRIVQGLTLHEFVAGSSEPVRRGIALRLPGSSRRFAMYSLNSSSNCFIASRSRCSFVKYGIIPPVRMFVVSQEGYCRRCDRFASGIVIYTKIGSRAGDVFVTEVLPRMFDACLDGHHSASVF
jgi:hypothetical protein